MSQRYQFLDDLYKTKQASTNQRLSYFELQENYMDWFAIIASFFMLVVEDLSLQSNVNHDQLVIFLEKILGILGVMETGENIVKWEITSLFKKP